MRRARTSRRRGCGRRHHGRAFRHRRSRRKGSGPPGLARTLREADGRGRSRRTSQCAVHSGGRRVENVAACAGLTPERVVAMVDRCTRDAARIPHCDEERRLDAALAHAATRLASSAMRARSRPSMRPRARWWSSTARIWATPRRSSATGGVFAHGLDPASPWAAISHPDEPLSLRPRKPDFCWIPRICCTPPVARLGRSRAP